MNMIKKFLFPFGGSVRADALSGLTVALALVPEAIAFALVAHVDPLVGLYSAFFMCLITALIGGRPGMISGATGSMAVVIVSLVSQYGIDYLFATIVLTGLLQIIIGMAKFGKFIRLLPKPVMIGFVNGLAIIIFIAQLEQFKTHINGKAQWLATQPLLLMLGLVIVSMSIIYLLPKLTKRLPSALIAIIVVTTLVQVFRIDTRIVEDMMAGHSVSAGLPTFALLHAPLNLSTLKIILPYAVILCIIGLSESLLTLSLIDEITHTRGRANKECVAQGISNVVCGFFKGMGGCVMIGQSMINISSGGRGRLSGIVAGLALLSFVVLLWSVIRLIPLSALVGVMFMVVIGTFDWTTFKLLRKIPKQDVFMIIAVTMITVFTNLAIATFFGVIIAALVFSWQMAKHIYVETKINTKNNEIEYILHGPLFFGSVEKFKTLFDFNNDIDDVVIDFKYSRVADHSAIDAIQFVTNRATKSNKKVHLRHLSPECKILLGKAGDMVEANIMEDPDYHVATDVLG
jgi:SulP family sulfate permease